ncbi:MAG: nucleotide exchange factor GrpE [Bacteriovoracaceae bacterium]
MSDTVNEEVKEEAEKAEEVKAGAETEETADNVEELKTEELKTEELKTEELKTEEKEEEDFKEKYYYLAAEMENLRRRFEREKEGIVKYGSEKILSSLLEVVDNFERTITALEKDEDEKMKNIVVGIQMVRDQFLGVLKDNGLEPIECLGKEFDPNFHEAMSQQAAEGKADNEIIMEFEKGYILNGRLLRASKVVVAKN